jgi:hypothetical protein
MNKIPYELKVILFSYVPTFGVNLFMRPFWGDNVDTNTNLALFGTVFTIFILPFYLLTINYVFAKQHKAEQFILNGLVMISCVFISTYFHFYNWADSIGSRDNPDGGTEAVMSLEKWGGSIICIIGTIIGHYNLIQNNKDTSGHANETKLNGGGNC